MKLRVLLAGAIMCVGLSACGAHATSAEQTSAGQSVTQQATSSRPIPPSSPTTPWSEDATMHQVESTVESWMRDTLHVDSTPTWVFAVAGQKACNYTVDERAAFFCPRERSVYIPIAAVEYWSSNQVLGDAYIAAHESTHFLQTLAGRVSGATVESEVQANCGSGVFVRWAIDHSLLNITPDEVRHLVTTVSEVPDTPAHNSADFAVSFDTGYQSGSLASCVPIAGPLAGA